MKIIETHCHLDYLKTYPLDEIIEKSHQEGVEKIITISVEPDNLDKVIELSKLYPSVFTTQGVHPHDAKLVTDEVYTKIKNNVRSHPKVLAIGEIGLDFHYNNSPKDVQINVFEKQLEIAIELNLPVVIHTREADIETIEILKKYAPRLQKKGVLHSFSSGLVLAQQAVELGFYLGFNGMITFKNAHLVREAVELCPIEKLILETDSPFLTPVPHRGKENGPYFLPFIAEKMAEIKKISVDDLTRQVYQNSLNLFFS